MFVHSYSQNSHSRAWNKYVILSTDRLKWYAYVDESLKLTPSDFCTPKYRPKHYAITYKDTLGL